MAISQSTAYRWLESSLLLKLYIQPNASRDEIAGMYGDRIKVRVSAPAIDNRANKKLITLMAEIFGVPKHSVTLISGEKSRNKTVSIQNPNNLPDWVTR